MAVVKNARRFRHKIVFEKKTKVADGRGGYSETWQDVFIAKADIKPGTYSKTLEASKITFNSVYKIYLRYNPQYDVQPGIYRMIYNECSDKEKTLTIHSVVNEDEENKLWYILAYTKI